MDGTLGGGGHAEGICRRLSPEGTLIGIDRDRDALRAAKERLASFSCRKYFFQSNYAEIRRVLQEAAAEGGPALLRPDGALLDLGVSSFQLDCPERGFSYMQDGPLDMRMDAGSGLTAREVVNTYSEADLTRILKHFGEERWAGRISRFIIEARRKKNLETTGELVEIIKAAIPAPARREGPHPAKRSFQAIRIEVNDELRQLERAVESFCDALAPGGRFCVIAFHSLEDRIVKEAFQRRENPCVCPPDFPFCVCGKTADMKRITRKPVVPREDRKEENPRARSARLRVAEKAAETAG